MIRYGKNGRISGLYLLKNIIQDRLITFSQESFTFSFGHHRLKSLDFSEGLKKEKELSDNIRHLTEDTVRLLYFSEEDESLRMDRSLVSKELDPVFPEGDITGMSWFLLFSSGRVKVSENRGKIHVRCPEKIYEGISGADSLLESFIRRIAVFSGDPIEAVYTEIVKENVYLTVPVSEDMTLTFSKDQEGTVENEEVFPDEREANIRRNFEAEMKRITDVIETLEQEREEEWEEKETEHISFSLPSGARPDPDEEDAYILPPDNIHIRILGFSEDDRLSGRILEEDSEDGTKKLLFIQTGGGVQMLELWFQKEGLPDKEHRRIFTDRLIRSIKWLQK